MEIGILRRVLKRAKRRSLVADEIPRLPERRDIGRTLTLLKMAALNPEWDTPASHDYDSAEQDCGGRASDTT